MADIHWHKQTAGKPLFSDLLWSRPENKQLAGKLLIVGGNLHGFAAPAQAYAESTKAGIGVSRVLLPDALQKTVGRIFTAGEYAPSTPSGSFNTQALGELLSLAAWADGTLLAGELGRNSQTAIMLEHFLEKNPAAITITRDAVDYFTAVKPTILQQTNRLLVCSIAQLQKLCTAAHFPIAITFSMDLLRLVDALQALTTQYPIGIIVKHLDSICVGYGGQVSTTKLLEDLPVWRVPVATHAAVWWLQNPTKAFEALTTAIYMALFKD